MSKIRVCDSCGKSGYVPDDLEESTAYYCSERCKNHEEFIDSGGHNW